MVNRFPANCEMGTRMNRKLKLAALSAAAMTIMAGAAHAGDPLPGLQNLNFLDYTGSAPKNCFQCVAPVGWTGGTGLIYIDAPGTATSFSGGIGTYQDPGPLNIPGGYNYVEADGNPVFESGFNYQVSGLEVGKTYTLSFYQAAGQQNGFTGDSTNQWIVSLADSGLLFKDDGLNDQKDVYYSDDPNASIAATTLMHVPSGGGVPWQFVSVDLTAHSTTETLSFLAWANEGSTVNVPPIAFLTGVNSPAGLNPGVPEPATWALAILGFAGAGSVLRRERAKRAAACA